MPLHADASILRRWLEALAVVQPEPHVEYDADENAIIGRALGPANVSYVEIPLRVVQDDGVPSGPWPASDMAAALSHIDERRPALEVDATEDEIVVTTLDGFYDVRFPRPSGNDQLADRPHYRKKNYKNTYRHESIEELREIVDVVGGGVGIQLDASLPGYVAKKHSYDAAYTMPESRVELEDEDATARYGTSYLSDVVDALAARPVAQDEMEYVVRWADDYMVEITTDDDAFAGVSPRVER